MYTTDIDLLEVNFGVAILSDLTGQPLNRNQQPVRLFDQTRHSAEYFFRADEKGKPYIQDFAQSRRYYPLTAYCQTHSIDYATALSDLRQQYSVESTVSSTKPVRRCTTKPKVAAPPVDYLPIDLYNRSRCQPERNGLFLHLRHTMGLETAKTLFDLYQIGTSRRWLYENALATSLPQFDLAGNLRQVKVIPFHPITGRRAKVNDNARRWNECSGQYDPDPKEKVWFAGRALSSSNSANLQQCYFGEHLLATYTAKPVALVEGESTAIVCSGKWPQYVWLATGGSTGGRWYTPERFSVLRDRNITLWPDTGKFDDWTDKAKLLKRIAKSVKISRLVEDNTPPGAKNIDLRDLLTWPRYVPNGGKPIYGEILEVASTENYPAEWDNRN